MRITNISEALYYVSDTAPSIVHTLFNPYGVPVSEFGIILSSASDVKTEAEISNFPELAQQMSARHRL